MLCFKVSLVILLVTLEVLLTNAYHTNTLVPALYVFGDSSVDAGNNNNLNTAAKANVFPYGIDFNNCSSGRFSNGKTFADIIGKLVRNNIIYIRQQFYRRKTSFEYIYIL